MNTDGPKYDLIGPVLGDLAYQLVELHSSPSVLHRADIG